MTRLRRALAAAALTAAVAVAAPTTAHAAGCTTPPMPSDPTRGLIGIIDPGPTEGTSTYAQLGWGGYELPMLDASFCVPGLPARETPPDGAAKIGNRALGLAVLIGALVTAAVGLAFSGGGVWDALTRVLAVQGLNTSPALILGLICAGSAIALMLASWRANRTPEQHHRSRIQAVKGNGIAALGLLFLLWGLILPAVQTTIIATALTGTQVLATGSSGSARDFVGTLWQKNITDPAFGHALLGDDPSAVQAYTWRLRAASTLSRNERSEITRREQAGEPTGAYRSELDDTKRRQYEAIADEIARTHPSSRARLGGQETSTRRDYALIGAGLAISSGAVLLLCLAVVIIARVLVPICVQVFPAASALLQLPRYQHIAEVVLMSLVRWTWRAVLDSGFDTGTRFFLMAACNAAVVFAVVKREEIMAAARAVTIAEGEQRTRTLIRDVATASAAALERVRPERATSGSGDDVTADATTAHAVDDTTPEETESFATRYRRRLADTTPEETESFATRYRRRLADTLRRNRHVTDDDLDAAVDTDTTTDTPSSTDDEVEMTDAYRARLAKHAVMETAELDAHHHRQQQNTNA